MNDMHVEANNPINNDSRLLIKPYYLSWIIPLDIKNRILRGVLIKRDQEGDSLTFYDGYITDRSEESSGDRSSSQFELKYSAVQKAVRTCETLDAVLIYIRSLGQTYAPGRYTPQKEAWSYFVHIAKEMGIEVFYDLIHYLNIQPGYMLTDFLAVLNHNHEREVVEHRGHRYQHKPSRSCAIL